MSKNGDTALATQETMDATTMELALVSGDLDRLTPQQRLNYYGNVCDSLGLNPLTKPFDYIKLNGKLTLYARRDAADQLRKIHGVNIQIISRETIGDVYVVTARATDRDGRCDESTGAVSVKGLAGDALANAYMKAETKAKRRVTLSLCGLGFLDETEVSTIPDARVVNVSETGEIQPEQSQPTGQPTGQPTAAGKGSRSWPNTVLNWALDNLGEYYASRQHVVNALNQSDYDPKRDAVEELQRFLAEHAAKRMAEKEDVEEGDFAEGGNNA